MPIELYIVIAILVIAIIALIVLTVYLRYKAVRELQLIKKDMRQLDRRYANAEHVGDLYQMQKIEQQRKELNFYRSYWEGRCKSI